MCSLLAIGMHFECYAEAGREGAFTGCCRASKNGRIRALM
jgi:hypothetical protein